MTCNFSGSLRRAALGLAMLFAAGAAAAAATTVTLTAQRGATTLPDGATVPMWGYCGDVGPNDDASPAAGTVVPVACTAGWSVGPKITVPAGSDLIIKLSNQLPVSTSMVVLGQLGGGVGVPTKLQFPQHAPQTQTTWPANGTASFTPPKQDPRVVSMGTSVAKGVTSTLTWTNLQPGTYLYETGTLPSIQAPMGLYGVLVVTAPDDTSGTNPIAQAYPGVKIDADVSLLFSEIDPAQNAAVDAAVVAAGPNAEGLATKRFDDSACAPKCYPAAVNYTPTYFLINGRAYDKAAPDQSAFAIAGTSAAPGAAATGKLLVRLLNAGLRTHVPTIVGLPMAIVAEDGNLAPGKPKLQNEVLLTAGKTHDVLVSPGSANNVYGPAIYPLFDRQLSLSSANIPDGGMQGFLQVAAAGAASGNGAVPVAAQPLAVNDAYQVPFNGSVNGNVKLNDVAIKAVALVSGTVNGGLLTLQPDGSFVYTAAAGYSGTDSFTYNGNGGTSNTATVTLTVGAKAAAPVANNDSFDSSIATRLFVSRPGVLANDNGQGYPLTASLNGIGSCASVTVNSDGSFTAMRNGAATSCQFSYVAKNSQGTASNVATVNVNFVPAGRQAGLSVVVNDASNGTPITDYRWIIQEDLTFKVDPTGTPSPSTRTLGTSFHTSHMPVVASGCVGAVSCGDGQTVGGVPIPANPATLPRAAVLDPNKAYYLSILPGDAGDGEHAMGGAPITPAQIQGNQTITVRAQPEPLIPAQLSIYIYQDNAPVNGQDDLNETGLGGFNIILMDAVGRSGDVAGQQSYDAAGMPLSNWLLGRPGCPDDRNALTNGSNSTTPGEGNIVGVVYTCPNAPPGYNGDPAVYALAGHALIKNVTPARYDVLAHPSAERIARGEVWWQTETLEGTQAQDAFAGIKEPVYFQEFGPPGFHTTIGFVNPNQVKALTPASGGYTVSGAITNQRMSRPSDVRLFDSGSYDLLSSTTCQVALNSQGGTGAAIAIAQCDKDGNFHLDHVPTGAYELVIWDQWLDQIIQTQAVNVGTANVAMGNIPVLSWFTQHDQNIFLDSNQNGVYDDGEPGLSNLLMTMRYRDGGISNQTATDSSGNGLLAELFPLFNWYVSEADTTRFKQTGVNVIVDGGGQADQSNPNSASYQLYSTKYPTGESSNRVEIPGAYSYGVQSFISQRTTINWGRTPYVPNENGGIQGTVVYSTTRPFDDQRYNVQTIWEPLVPRVTVNLYRKDTLPDGTSTLTKVDSTLTSSWDDWVNALNADGTQKNMKCPGQLPAPPNGAQPPFDATQVDPFVSYTLLGDRFRCYDGFHNWNQAQPAPYDGRYSFPSAAYIAAHPLTNAQKAAGQTLVSLDPGQYVVEVVTPPGFEVVKEEDKNILNGDAFESQVPAQFGGITNIFILPDEATLNNANPNNPRNADGIQNNATSDLGVTASSNIFPECVGDKHRVPDSLSLYPQGGLVAPFAGQDRPLCDRKLVNLGDQMQASATFFVFTPVPMAAAGSGIILDDASSEFNATAPDFGEKASVPFVPVSIKDFNGREISRVYSDQWGAYNVMAPSSWLVNPPTPSGYGPNMLVTCMNDPGPIPGPNGTLITDPQYNPAYSNFCYTLPFMPGRTTYLDTPVLPIAAHAGGYTPADCAYPDATPAIARVDSSAGFGPYLSKTAGGTLTIAALGTQQVPNPNYAGPFATSGPSSLRTISRTYSFGGTKGTVKIGGADVTANVTSWTDTSITLTVPANTSLASGQLVVINANGKSTVDAVTVTIEDRAPVRVAGPSVEGTLPGAIQQAVDAAKPGDLILVQAGTYSELVVMWKPVRLQGVGAASVIVNATKYPTQKLEAWRPQINGLFSIDILTGNQTGISQVDPLPGQEITGGVVLLEPSVLGTEEGAGITVLAKDLPATQCNAATSPKSTISQPITDSNFYCQPSRIDGLSVTGGDAGGGIYVNGWAHNLEISNNRVYGNAGAFHGGVRVGVPYLENLSFPGLSEDTNGNVVGTPALTGPLLNRTIAGWGFDNNVKIHHNAITKNGVVEGPGGAGGAGGGISMCTGSDGYSVDHNWVCGNYTSGDGGGIGHIGFSQGGTIAYNQVLFNQSFQQTASTHGGGIAVEGEPPLFGATVSPGTGNLNIDANVIRGNFAEAGHGGGVRLQQVNGGDVAAFPLLPARWHQVTMTNNVIDNNVAGWAGGGVSLSDTIRSVVANNTVASNDSAGIAGSVLVDVTGAPTRGTPGPAGISSDPTSAQLIAALPNFGNTRAANAISKPAPFSNNIVWQNRAFYFDSARGSARLCNTNQPATNNAAPNVDNCKVLANQATTGACDATAVYWDLGALGDASVTPNANLNLRLEPTFSVLSTTSYGAAANGGLGSNGNRNTNPNLANLYCNGSRAAPEFPSVINPPSPKNFLVAATLDEGNNYVNMRFGPLTLAKPNDATGTAYTAFGDYHLSLASTTTNSSALDKGTAGVVTHDVDGDARPLGAAWEIGADEFVVPAPKVGFSVTSLDFGNQIIGTVSAAKQLVVTNTGNANLVINAATPVLTAGVSVSGNFAITSTTCNGATLAPAATCVVNVSFNPAAPAGAKTGTLTLRDNAAGSPQTVGLTGTAINAVTVAPGTVGFSSQKVGTTSATQTVTFTNNQAVAVVFNAAPNGVAITTNFTSGAIPQGEFVIVAVPGTNCANGGTVAAGASCVVGVQFKPAGNTGFSGAFGLRGGTLTFRDNAATSPQTVGLTGLATP